MKSSRQFERDWLYAGTPSVPHHQQWHLGQAEPVPVNNNSNMLSIDQPIGVGFSHDGKSAQRFTLSKVSR
jgi:carboxypeptidase C (cathepsin A)